MIIGAIRPKKSQEEIDREFLRLVDNSVIEDKLLLNALEKL